MITTMASGANCGNSALLLQLFVIFSVTCDAAVQDDNMLIDVEDSLDYSSDDVRCYCNLPVCVTSSYMCKSEEGVCFSEEEDLEQSSFKSHDSYKRRHGCLHLLEDEDQRAQCRNMPSSRGSFQSHSRLLFCCYKDMCNHADTRDPYESIHNTTRIIPDHSSLSNPEMMSPSPGYSSNEVWFKAAIIAVPICGVVILFLLIFLAVKILKTDSLSTSNKLGVPYTHTNDRKSNRDHFDQVHHQSSVSSKKIPLLIHHQHDLSSGGACTNHSSDELLKHTSVPLLVQNETGINYSYDKKNEANAKINLANGHEYNLVQNKDRENSSPLIGLHKLNTTSSNNVYRNVNLSLAPVQTVPTSIGDKLYDKQALNSVISWGGPSPSSPV